jgi:hypothetical protein
MIAISSQLFVILTLEHLEPDPPSHRCSLGAWGGGGTLTKMCTGYRLKTVQKIKEKEMSHEMVWLPLKFLTETTLVLSVFSKKPF